EGAPHAEASGSAIEAERALGAKAAGPPAAGRGRRDSAPAAGAGVEASAARGGAAESREAGEARVCRLRAHPGGGVSGGAARGRDQQGNAAPDPDDGRSLEAEAAAGGGGACLASPPGLLGGVGAVGHLGA